MSSLPRYAHTSLVARDWRALAAFYCDVFGCEALEPERDQAGEWLERGTGVAGLRIRGVHLRLPGWGSSGPTLEVYTYTPSLERARPQPNRPGLGHLAFQVDDVPATLERVVSAGGERLGEPVEQEVAGAGLLHFVYARDPEGNILELQRWR